LRLEETRFRRTLERGLAILDEESRALAEGQKLSGDVAFTLYDTYGFPLDLTQDALRAEGKAVDVDGWYERAEALRIVSESRQRWQESRS